MATAPISDTTTRADYTATASQTIFPYTWWIKDEDHLDVYVNGTLQTITTDYTVSVTQSVTGGNVVFTSGLSADDAVAIVYNPDIERQSEFQTSGELRASSLNLELTYLTSLCQYLDTQLGRAIQWEDTVDTSGFTFQLADPTGNAGNALIVNSTEDGIEYTTLASSTAIGNFETLVTDGNNSDTVFALGFTPASVNSILVEVDGVLLEPTVDYTVATTNIIFTVAPSSGTDNIIVKNLASGVAATTPADSSVTTAKIQSGAVTATKIDPDFIGDFTDVTITASDLILYGDATDSNNAKRDTVQGIIDLVPADLAGKADTVITASDTILFFDDTDSDLPKTDTVQGILDLATSNGGLVLISTATASSSSTVEFNTGIDDTYEVYQLHLIDIVPQTDNTNLYMRTSTDGGSTFDSGASNYAYSTSYNTSGNIAVDTESNAAAQIMILAGLGTGTGEAFNAVINLFNPAGTKYTQIAADFTDYDANANIVTGNTAGARLSAADVDAIQFLMSSGNIASGEFKLYGVKKS